MAADQPPLDPGVLEVIRWSAGWLSRRPDAFIGGLQADIAALIPDLAVDGRAFCERMVHAVLWSALTDSPPDVVAGSLRWVGTMNHLEGFPEAQYVDVAHALVRVVHDLAGSSWSTSMGSAWISYFLWLRPFLMDGAQNAAAQQAAQDAARQAAQDAARQAAQDAARQAAERAARPGAGQAAAAPGPPPGEVDLESVAGLLDDEDEEDSDSGYGQIMVSMTRSRRDKHPH